MPELIIQKAGSASDVTTKVIQYNTDNIFVINYIFVLSKIAWSS